ncbi:MAG: hypothetical protein ABSC19_10680 [Syntrophorhabdales bacterium]|jgi:hypothetical protein
MRGDDHELTGSLTIIKFFFEPVITCLVKKAMPMWMSRLRGIKARFALPAFAGMTAYGQL